MSRDAPISSFRCSGKLLTTKTAIAEMSMCSLRGSGSRPAEVDDGVPASKTGGPTGLNCRPLHYQWSVQAIEVQYFWG
jgi:hypothetical protein